MTAPSIYSVIGLFLLAGCTVKDIDAPALSGPSTFATSIAMRASPDTLIQDGASQSVITITALDAEGRAKNIPLRADISIGGVIQDFGRLSTKQPVANGTPLIYTAPPTSSLAAGQVPQTVTILITPTDGVAFDGRGEFARQVDIRLMPQGIILPTNPNLVANFAAPSSPKVLDVLTFDASASTNNGVACGTACTYAWSFGDGTTSSGQVTTHQFRAAGTYPVTLAVTDIRGAQSSKTTALTVEAGTPPPPPSFTFSPQPAVVDQAIFFNASESRAAPGRTLVRYDWDFGKGTTGTGVTVSKAYDAPGDYVVTLKVTDDAGAFSVKSTPVKVNSAQIQPNFTIDPADPVVNQPIVVNASSTTSTSPIVSYSWNFGVGAVPSAGTGVNASTQYAASGSKVITLTVTDNQGRTASSTKVVTVKP